MTGTAETEAAEFMSTYELGVVPIPTHKRFNVLIGKTWFTNTAKFAAVIEDVAERHKYVAGAHRYDV